MNLATYTYEHDVAARESSRKLLIDAINQLGEAKSLAALSGQKSLRSNIEKIRRTTEALAGYYLRGPDVYSAHEANRFINDINEVWPSIYQELESAYARTEGDA